MVFKKPYALLIKYFKLIHIFISIFMGYLIYKMGFLVKFFNGYISSGWVSINETEVSSYINPLIYISIIIILALSITIYFLMKFKNKPRLYYILTPILYSLVLVVFIVTNSILHGAQTDVVSPIVSRAIRDVLLIFTVLQSLFIIFSVLRAIGFDVKKFNFRQDIADLQITELDNEEVEVDLEVKKYKIKRKYRRRIRNFKYVFMEHKFLFSFLIIGVVASFIITAGLNIFVFNKVYKEENIVNLDSYNMSVTGSYLYETDFKGNEISDKYQYMVVNTRIINRIIGNTFKMNNLSLEVNGQIYSPSTNVYSKFLGFGVGYPEGMELSSKDVNEYIFVFKIPKDVKVRNAVLRYMYKTTYKKDLPVSNYRKIKLNYSRNIQSYKYNIKNLNEKMEIGDTNINIKSIEFGNTFDYKYDFCISKDNCVESTGYVNNSNYNNIILKLEADINMGNNLNVFNFSNKGEIFSNFGIIRYINNDKEYVQKNIKNLTFKNTKNNAIYLLVNKDIKDSKNIKLELIIKNFKYTFNLKNE